MILRAKAPALVFLSLALVAAAPPLDAAARATPPVDVAEIEAHLAFLADDRLQGRDTGSAGYEIAALYAASRFGAYGLAPAGDRGFEQRIRFATARLAGSSLEVRAGGGSPVALAPLTDYLLQPAVALEQVDLAAPVVFAGYGVDAPELGRRDYEGLDVAGKIVLVVSGAPPRFPADQRAHHGSRRSKAAAAAARGAVGLVTLRTPAEEKRVPWARLVANTDRDVMRYRHPDGTIEDSFAPLAFGAVLSMAGAEKLAGAAGLALDELLERAEEKASRNGPLGVELAARSTARLGEVASPNVVARLAGSDSRLAAEHVVLSAHLDHIGVGAAVEGDSIYNGYYDNAMGSAIVLEAARRLAATRPRPRRSVVFLLVTAEEKGLLGADFFAHHPTVPAESLVANVNVDMPLLLAPLADLVAFGAEHSSLGALADRAAHAHGFALAPDPLPEESIFVRSDQYAFIRRGVPAIFLAAGSSTRGGGDAQARAVGEFFAEHYHRPSDEAALGADRGSLERFTEAVTDLVRRIADADARPRWKEGDYFGETYGAAPSR